MLVASCALRCGWWGAWRLAVPMVGYPAGLGFFGCAAAPPTFALRYFALFISAVDVCAHVSVFSGVCCRDAARGLHSCLRQGGIHRRGRLHVACGSSGTCVGRLGLAQVLPALAGLRGGRKCSLVVGCRLSAGVAVGDGQSCQGAVDGCCVAQCSPGVVQPPWSWVARGCVTPPKLAQALSAGKRVGGEEAAQSCTRARPVGSR